MMVTPSKAKWDRWAIAAELKRRDISFKSMARESGLAANSLHGALRTPIVKANRLIAEKLGVPMHELWPDWFDADGDLIPARYRRKLTQKRQAMASRESRAA